MATTTTLRKDVVIPPTLLDTPETRRDLASYYNEIARLDYYVGEVEKELARQGILENTIVIFMSDNGRPFPGSKTRVYDTGMRTPFIIKWPQSISIKGGSSNSLASSIDIAPTLLTLAGVDVPATMQGRSFDPLLKSPATTFRQYVFSEHNWHDYEAYERAVRTRDYLYVINKRPELDNGGSIDVNQNPSANALKKAHPSGKLTPIQADFLIKPRSAEEFFDCRKDPIQAHNEVNNPKYAREVAQLRAVLREWQEKTGDSTPETLTADWYDRETGKPMPAQNQRGEMPGRSNRGRPNQHQRAFLNKLLAFMKKTPTLLAASGALLVLIILSSASRLFSIPASHLEKEPGPPDRPNIIFILSDDHAYQAIGAYGSKIARTPHIDRLAKEGALFQNMFVTNSICGPSRATLLTGKYSHLNGFRYNGKDVFDSRQPTFATILQSNGYQTAWIGKWHLGSTPVGFDYWKIPPGQGHYYNPDFIGSAGDTTQHEGYITEIITKLSLDWLDTRPKAKPFVLVIGEKATHRTWVPDLQDLGSFDNTEFPLPENFDDDYAGRLAAAEQDMSIRKTMNLAHDLKVHTDYRRNVNYNRFTPEQKKVFSAYYDGKITKEFETLKAAGGDIARWKYQRYMRDYLSTAASLDRNIGKILDYLDQTGLAKNTVVVYGSDQGFYLGEHGWFDKRFMYEESFKTPFLVRYPGVTKPGSLVKELAINIDWAPTILDMAGVEIPKEMQGRSFLPLLAEKNTQRTLAQGRLLPLLRVPVATPGFASLWHSGRTL